MSTPLADLARQLAFNDKLLELVTAEFDDHDWLRRAGDSNHAQWLLGHLASTRRSFLRLVGVQAGEEVWEKHFGMGSHSTPQSDDISPAMLREAFVKDGAAMRAHLVAMTAEQADAPFKTFPDGARTVGGGARFLHFHESYHLGQIGLLRRMAGKKGFA